MIPDEKVTKILSNLMKQMMIEIDDNGGANAVMHANYLASFVAVYMMGICDNLPNIPRRTAMQDLITQFNNNLTNHVKMMLETEDLK